MKLEEIKQELNVLKNIRFRLPNGELVPRHFHVTEFGKVTKNFIDCGGTVRNEEVASFQLWEAEDYDHRLHPQRLFNIIESSQKVLKIDGSIEVEVEYQRDTIGKYGLTFDGEYFQLTKKNTDCLALENCVVPQEKSKVPLSNLSTETKCAPGGNCC